MCGTYYRRKQEMRSSIAKANTLMCGSEADSCLTLGIRVVCLLLLFTNSQVAGWIWRQIDYPTHW